MMTERKIYVKINSQEIVFSMLFIRLILVDAVSFLNQILVMLIRIIIVIIKFQIFTFSMKNVELGLGHRCHFVCSISHVTTFYNLQFASCVRSLILVLHTSQADSIVCKHYFKQVRYRILSIKQIANKMGPDILPCITEILNFFVLEYEPLMLNFCYKSFK